MRFFLDTNVLISAVLFGGVPGRLVDAVRDGRADGIVSLHVLSEFVAVLTRPRFGIDETTAVALAEEVASFAHVIPLMVATGSWVADRDDDPVVETALVGRATHLVTGDIRIHECEVEGVHVVTPAEAICLVEALEAPERRADRLDEMPVPVDRANDPMRRGKLTADQVRAIAECVAAGERHTAVAERFGVSVETVGAIKSGKRWAGVIDDMLRARMNAAPTSPVLDTSGARRVMAALEAGRSGRSIAEEFGISPSMVSAIKHGQAWSALDPDLPARLAQKPRQGKALSAPQVAQIKQRLLAGQSSRKVAAEFGVSGSTVQAISQGRTWADVVPRGAGDEA